MMTEEITTRQAQENNGFHAKTANEWVREARKRPIPRSLFGEFWLENELAILFGDTGKGKSVLAIQIAESIARRRHIEPLAVNAEPRPVAYLDLEMTDKQFEMRYSEDHAGGRARFLRNHYSFSDNFHRVEVDLTDAPTESAAFAEYFVRRSEEIVREKEAMVLIIDNITFLKRSNYGAREILPLMKALNRLKRQSGLSILVVAHSHRRSTSHPIGISDLQESRLLGRYADTIFAIGQSRLETCGRYIKHLKQRSNTLVYDASHVPTFRLKKIGGNFLGFEFDCFAPEIELLDDIRNQREWETIEKIKQASDGGASIREIAELMSLPKTTVHRLLQMWRPPVSEPESQKPGACKPPIREHDFPGCEEFDEAANDPRFNDIYEREDAEDYALRREAYLIDAARARARKQYLECGRAPNLAEALDMIGREADERRMAAASDLSAVEPAAEAGGFEPDDRNRGLERSYTALGKEIFIEKRGPNGQPDIWYSHDTKGNRMRHVRKDYAIFVTLVDAAA